MLHRLLFPELAEKNWLRVNLNQEAMMDPNATHPHLINPVYCGEFVKRMHEHKKVDFSYGGYLEDRDYIWQGHYQKHGETVHVGVDYNVPAGTQVRLPRTGTLIMLEQDPDTEGGWGTRAIFRMGALYVTFAHLWVAFGFIGRDYAAGMLLGEVGNPSQNGGWYPHLHVQAQTSYNPSLDGYHKNSDELARLFPNPEDVLV